MGAPHLALLSLFYFTSSSIDFQGIWRGSLSRTVLDDTPRKTLPQLGYLMRFRLDPVAAGKVGNVSKYADTDAAKNVAA